MNDKENKTDDLLPIKKEPASEKNSINKDSLTTDQQKEAHLLDVIIKLTLPNPENITWFIVGDNGSIERFSGDVKKIFNETAETIKGKNIFSLIQPNIINPMIVGLNFPYVTTKTNYGGEKISISVKTSRVYPSGYMVVVDNVIHQKKEGGLFELNNLDLVFAQLNSDEVKLLKLLAERKKNSEIALILDIEKNALSQRKRRLNYKLKLQKTDTLAILTKMWIANAPQGYNEKKVTESDNENDEK